MYKYRFFTKLTIILMGLAWLNTVTATDFSQKWEEKFYNPKPLDQDVILPMPCGGNMVFRVVKTNTTSPLEDIKITLGGNSETDGYADFETQNYIAGGFADKAKQRYFLMAKYEVSTLQYNSVMQNKCSKVNLKGLLPITNISWFDAVAFSDKYTQWLLKNAADKLPKEDGVNGFVRLPTNAEWEFASRGATAVSISEFRENIFPNKDGIHSIAWFNDSKSANGKLQLIGRLKPNQIGLFDTLGNASEMIFDSFKANKLNRYHGQASGMVVRGGSYLKSKAEVNNVSRLEQPYYAANGSPKKSKDMGFRVVLTVPLLTSSSKIKQLESEWKSLGSDSENVKQQDDNVVDTLENLAKNVADKELKNELNATKDKLRAANQASEEQRNVAVQSALQLGAFLCSNVSDLNGVLEQSTRIVDSVKSIYPDDKDKLKKPQQRLDEAQKALDYTLRYYADTIVSVSGNYLEKTLASQVGRTKYIIAGHGNANLSSYIDLYWQQLRLYYQDGKVNLKQWLSQCTNIKENKL